MAPPSHFSNATNIANILNLSSVDSEAYFDIINDYFGERTEEHDDSSSESSDDEDQVNNNPDHDQYLPVTVDLAETLVPMERNRDREPIQIQEDSITSTTDPTLTKPPCSCKLNGGTPCHTHFSPDDIESFTLQYRALTNTELDISVLSKIACGLHLGSETQNSKRVSQSKRKASRADYYHHGQRICRDFLKYIHSISQDKLTALVKHYKASGVEALIHKNSKKRPKNSLQYDDTRRVIDFILNFAEVYSIQLPGRTPHHWITDCKLLPTNCTKASVYAKYSESATIGGFRVGHSVNFGKPLFLLANNASSH